MKKYKNLSLKLILIPIITLTCFFSSSNNTFSANQSIEDLLNLNTGIEEYNLNLANLDYIFFNSNKNQYLYSEFKKINIVLKKEIIRVYKNGDFEYYQVNGIIKNHRDFVYYTNKYFYYLSIQERYPYYVELDSAILKNYRELKGSFIKVKNLVRK